MKLGPWSGVVAAAPARVLISVWMEFNEPEKHCRSAGTTTGFDVSSGTIYDVHLEFEDAA